MTSSFERCGDALNEVAPVRLGFWIRLVQINFDTVRKVFRVHNQLSVIPRIDCGPYIELDGGWHHKAIVIVGMLADQIDPSRSTKQARSMAIAFAETLRQLRGCTRCR